MNAIETLLYNYNNNFNNKRNNVSLYAAYSYGLARLQLD